MTDYKKDRQQVLDPAVADLLDSMQKKITYKLLPKKKRDAIARERAKIEARRDFRVTYDLPQALRDSVRDLAEEQGVPASQLAALALLRFMDDYKKGQVDLDALKEPSHSPRYDWNLNLPSGSVKITDVRKKKKTVLK
jgi:hypothetical protein